MNPERAWPALERLEALTEAAGHTLAPRLTIYPEFALDPGPLAGPGDALLRPRRLRRRGPGPGLGVVLGRRGGPPRSSSTRPGWATPECPRAAVGEVLAGVAAGQEVGEDEIVTLFSARGAEVRAVAALADQLRAETSATTSPSSSTATSTTPTSAPSSASSAPSARARCRSTSAARPTCSTSTRSAGGSPRPRTQGATEVCLQGGIHPNFDGDYYLDVAARGAGRLRAHPHPRVHRARGDRGGASFRCAA